MTLQFKALLESELLNEEVKTQLSSAVNDLRESVEEETRKKIEIEFAKRFELDKIELNKNLSQFVSESVAADVVELKEDLVKYRHLEVEYAAKLENFKTEYSKTLKENLDTFIKNSIISEVVELKEDINMAKGHVFGKLIFEAFEEEFVNLGFGGDLKAVQDKLKIAESALNESKTQIELMEREKIVEGLLSNLSGSKRNIMKTILENVPTVKLVGRYEESLKSLLSEDVDNLPKPTTEESKKTKVAVLESTDSTAHLDRLRKLSGRKA